MIGIESQYVFNCTFVLIILVLRRVFLGAPFGTDLDRELSHHMSRVLRKPIFGIPDQVRHKPVYTSTEES